MQMHEHQHSRNAEKHEMFHSWQVGDNKFANLDGKRTLENSQTPAPDDESSGWEAQAN
jgi:hypothetical protein